MYEWWTCYEATHHGSKVIIMPHNLMIVNYALGQLGSVHDAYAFQGTQMLQDPTNSIPPNHWIWADSAYPFKTWCTVPFKKPCGGRLTWRQNTYNRYLSKVCLKDPAWCNSLLTILKICVRVEHVFAALKGRFQSLWELRLKMKTDDDLHIAVYWITCCMILHNMVICFETRWREELGEGTMSWVIREAEWEDEDEEGGEERGGTPGLQFRGLLMERLFEQRGIQF